MHPGRVLRQLEGADAGNLCNCQRAAHYDRLRHVYRDGAACPIVRRDVLIASSVFIVLLFGNLASLISTWSFQSWDRPVYRIGNGLNFDTSTTMMLAAFLALILHPDFPWSP